jgi:hypothetical protein
MAKCNRDWQLATYLEWIGKQSAPFGCLFRGWFSFDWSFVWNSSSQMCMCRMAWTPMLGCWLQGNCGRTEGGCVWIIVRIFRRHTEEFMLLFLEAKEFKMQISQVSSKTNTRNAYGVLPRKHKSEVWRNLWPQIYFLSTARVTCRLWLTGSDIT